MSGAANGPGGKQPPGPAPEQAAMMQQAQAQVIQMMAMMITSLSSSAPPMQQVMQVCGAVIGQQEQLGKVMEDAAMPEMRQKHPQWGFKLRHKGSGATGEVRVPKDFAECKTLDEVLHYASVVSLVTNPVSRALLFAHGFEVEFFQTGPKPKIIMPS